MNSLVAARMRSESDSDQGQSNLNNEIDAADLVYFDTNVITTALAPGLPHHRAARDFCDGVIHDRNPVAFSELLRLEYAHYLRAIPGSYDPATLRSLGLHRWEREDVRRRWLRSGFSDFERFVSQFAAISEVMLTRDIIDYATDLMIICNLGSYDAADVATAISIGASRIATLDKQFVRARSVIDVQIIAEDEPPDAR
jgi:predicted nucleic acid-binding protein